MTWVNELTQLQLLEHLATVVLSSTQTDNVGFDTDFVSKALTEELLIMADSKEVKEV